MTKSSDVLILGGGAAGLCAAGILKKHSVTVMEKPSPSFRLGKRILVSGNGRANFFNSALLQASSYDSYPLSAVKDIVLEGKKNWAALTLDYLVRDCGLDFREDNGLLYPFFNRSECLQGVLLSKAEQAQCSILEGRALTVLPEKKQVRYRDGQGGVQIISYKTLIFAPGGRSYDRPDFTYDLLNSLGVSYRPFEPCLCPIRVKERIPPFLSKNRLQGRLSLCVGKKVIHTEDGEILFKDDGLSGIAVFNMSLYLEEALSKKGKGPFVLSLDYSLVDGKKADSQNLSSFPSFLVRYLQDRKAKPYAPLTFTFRDFYPFSDSQVSYGGILLSEIDPSTLRLKKWKDIIVLGETLDQTFLCGGYNLGIALTEAYKACKIDEEEKHHE